MEKSWHTLLLRGVVGITVGLVVLTWPIATLAGVVLLFGIYSLVDGILTLAFGAGRASSGWLFVLEGLIGIALGLVVLFASSSLRPLVWPLIAGWALATGIVEIVAAARMHREPMLFAAGVIAVTLSATMLIWPHATAVTAVFLLGSYALFFGSAMLALALRRRRAS